MVRIYDDLFYVFANAGSNSFQLGMDHPADNFDHHPGHCHSHADLLLLLHQLRALQEQEGQEGTEGQAEVGRSRSRWDQSKLVFG